MTGINDPKAIFYEALGRPAGPSRAAYLDQRCQGDAALRAEIEGILHAHEAMGHFLEGLPPSTDSGDVDPPSLPVSERPGTTVGGYHFLEGLPPTTVPGDVEPSSLPVSERPGATVGRYRLLEPIGEGGMGVVFLAEQVQPVRRRVALKVIKPGMDTRQVIVRFEAERQALALMDHPNIARVLDAGATDSGRPFFVMELVDGVPITEYCDRHRLPIARRIALFTQVCQAVQHAHQKGIIHRDLKPSNVLVATSDGVPVPKVIDFGVAKATDPGLTERTSFTAAEHVVGTPLYMSPEQAVPGSRDVDTRADVYSLGVLLYELLTGTTPFTRETFKATELKEVLRALREDEPPRPSVRLAHLGECLATVSAVRASDPGHLNREVRGELDWVVMKCLEKDRSRRYETANGLARDLERFLADQPVEACPPSVTYRFRKFARRQRAVLTTAALVASLVLLGSVVSVWLAIRATRAERRAEDRSVIARRAVDQMYTEVAEKWLSHDARLSPVQTRLLENALAFYETFAAEEGGDPETRGAAARAAERVGAIRHKLGSYEAAAQAYQRALTLLGRSDDPSRASADDRRAIARSLNAAGHQFQHLGRKQDATRDLTAALELREQLASEFPDSPDDQADLAACLENVGMFEHSSGGLPGTGDHLRRGHDLASRLVAQWPANTRYRALLASLTVNLAASGRPEESGPLNEKALALYQRLAEEEPDNEEHRRSLALCHTNLGAIALRAGRKDEGLAVMYRALPIVESLAASHPDQPLNRQSLVSTILRLGSALASLQRLLEAEPLLRRAVDLAEALDHDVPGVPDYKGLAAECHEALGNIFDKSGRPHDAVREREMALALLSDIVTSETDLGPYRNHLAQLARRMSLGYSTAAEPTLRDPARAEELAKRALQVHASDSNFLAALALAQTRSGDHNGALETLTMREGVLGRADVEQRLLVALVRAGRNELDEAKRSFAQIPRPLRASEAGGLPRSLYKEVAGRLGVEPTAFIEAEKDAP